MQTTFFNVGHGEAISIELDGNGYHAIVRDLGRSQSAIDTNTSLSLDKLLQRKDPGACCKLYYHLMSDVKFDAVLSHAHQDHLNGFKALYDHKERDVFENGYIPWLSMADLDSLGGIMIKHSLFLHKYYGGNSMIGEDAKLWLIATPIMAALSKNLWCVSAGHMVQHWPQNKILWPLPCLRYYELKLRGLWKYFLFENGLSSDFLEEEAEEIRRALSRFYFSTDGDRESRPFSDDETSYAIETILRYLSDDFSEEERKKFRSPHRINPDDYRMHIDNHSLIFEIGKTGCESLFLSDANNATIKSMLKSNNLADKHYHLIKSGHHGNRGAKQLYDKKITSDIVVNCCGPAHPSYGGPDRFYENISKDLRCTDWNDNSHNWNDRGIYDVSDKCHMKV